MPKSSPTSSPQSSSSHPKPLSEAARMTDVALRKKKNADAQAAFRARRANYIATLEETVTNLESVVLELQESWRLSRKEIADLQQENHRIRQEHREREKFWRVLYEARKTGRTAEVDDLPLPPPPLASPFTAGSQAPVMSQPSANVMIQQAYDNPLGYRGEDGSGSRETFNGSEFSGQPAHFPNNDPSCPTGASGSTTSHRAGKYPPYSYPLTRDARWPVSTLAAGSAMGDSTTPPHSESPVYVNSPSLTATTEMQGYPPRFGGEDQKSTLNSVLENAPYVFPNADRFHHQDGMPSRSLSPTLSTLSSNASNALTSYQFAFHEANGGQDRPEFDYRRHSLPNCPEVTLHGGTADISLTGQGPDAVRYRLGRKDSYADRQPVPSIHQSSQHDSTVRSGGGDASSNAQLVRTRQNDANSHSHSRSRSSSPSQFSCTVAVIKAHAFGSLRRTRTKTKRTAEGAQRVAMDVLEARGMGVGPSTGSKRPRLDDDDHLEEETP